MKIEVRPATESEKLNIDPEAETLPEGVTVHDTGEEAIFLNCPVGDSVLVSEHPDLTGTFLVQHDGHGSCFAKKVGC